MNGRKRLAAIALGALLALTIGAGEARAQTACTPTQTVSAEPDARGRYTTTIACADTAAAAGAADYRELHYNHGSAEGTNPADFDDSIPNNNANNNVMLTIGSGVVFTATGTSDMGGLELDGAIVLNQRAGAKTLVVEEGAVINLQRTPNYANPYQDTLLRLTGIYVQSGGSDGDMTIRFNGVMNMRIDVQGSWGGSYNGVGSYGIQAHMYDPDAGPTRASSDILIELGENAVVRQVAGGEGIGGINGKSWIEDGDVIINLAKGSLVDTSLAGGAAAVKGDISSHSSNAGVSTGNVIINAAGTIRNAVSSRTLSLEHGYGILASNEGGGIIRITSSGTVETRQKSAIVADAEFGLSGQIDDPDTPEIEGNLIDVTGGMVLARAATGVSVRSHGANVGWTVRVAEGATVRAQWDGGPGALSSALLGSSRGTIAEYAGVRRVEGLIEPVVIGVAVRRRTEASEGVEDRVFIDGTVETVDAKAGVDPAVLLQGGGRAQVGATGRLISNTGLAISSGFAPPETLPADYVATASDLTVVVAGEVEGDVRVVDQGALSLGVLAGGEVTGDVYAMGDGALSASVAGKVTGDVRTMGDGDLTLGVLAGGDVTGDVYTMGDGDLSASVAGTVVGDVRTTGDGDLTADVSGTVVGAVRTTGDGALRADVSGTVGGDVRTMGKGDLTAVVSGTIGGDVRTMGKGDLTAVVSGTIGGDVQTTGDGGLRVTVEEGGAILGTVHDPTAPMTVDGSVGRILLGSGGTVAVGKTGRITGVEGDSDAISSGAAPPETPPDDYEAEASDLTVTVAGAVAGDIRVLDDGDLRAVVSGKVNGDLRTMGAGALTVAVAAGGTITGTVHDPTTPMTVEGTVGRVLLSNGGTLMIGETGRISGVSGSEDAIRSESGDLDVVVAGRVDGSVVGAGSGDHRVTVRRGGVVTGEIHLAASRLRVDGRIGSARFGGSGTLTVGAGGVISGRSGMAIQGGGGTLSVSLALNGRRMRDVVRGRISNEGGETIMVVNGLRVHDGMEMTNGAWDLTLRAGSDGTFSPENSIETLAPRAGVYESLPGLLLRMESGRARGRKATAAGSPVWARASTASGSRGTDLSASNADYDFSTYGAEAGLRARFPWAEGLAGSLSVRYGKGSAETSMPSGEGEIALEGIGLGAGLFWEHRSGLYLSGDASWMEYDADLSSKARGALRGGVAAATVLTLDAEAGVRLAILRRRLVLAPRAWISRSGVAIDSFTDAVGASFRLLDGTRVTAGGGLVVETRTLLPAAGGGDGLSLRYSVDYGSVLSGEETEVEVSGQKLAAKTEKNRLLMGLGAKWRAGRLTIAGGISASGAGVKDETYGGRLSVGLRF